MPETSKGLGGRVLDVAQKIVSHHHFAKDVAGTLYHYRGGVYRPDGKDQIAKATKELMRISGYWDGRLIE